MPGNTGPFGVGIFYPGDGAGVGSALAVPGINQTIRSISTAAQMSCFIIGSCSRGLTRCQPFAWLLARRLSGHI
jgi:hypothetical protein